MTKTDLIDKVAEETGLTKKDTGEAINSTIDTIMNYLKEDNNFKVNYQKNKMAIEHLCAQVNAKLLFLHVEDWEFDYRNDLARDLMHPGVNSHGLIANEMLKYLGT